VERRSLFHTGNSHLTGLEQQVARLQGERLNNAAVRERFSRFHDWYVDELKPALQESSYPENNLATLDLEFDQIKVGAGGRTRRTAGKQLLRTIRTSLTALERDSNHAALGSTLSTQEILIVDALEAILPSAAAGYRQAVDDLSSATRRSFRGVAAEFREVVRELLDHLAPDSKVGLTSEGRKPTMKAKVRFLLKNRQLGETERATAESAAEIADAGVPNLARSVYDLGSLGTHVSQSRIEVARFRSYLLPLLIDLLSIPH
jgi:hypothetical protein